VTLPKLITANASLFNRGAVPPTPRSNDRIAGIQSPCNVCQTTDIVQMSPSSDSYPGEKSLQTGTPAEQSTISPHLEAILCEPIGGSVTRRQGESVVA
jgi:hypothetical protein